MTDTSRIFAANSDDPLVQRIVTAARTQDREVPIPSLHVVQEELHERLVHLAGEVSTPDVRRIGRQSISRAARRSVSRVSLWATALVVAIVAGVALWTGDVRSGAHHVPRMSVYATRNGQQATITLPDGSVVLLNVASRLEVPADYERGNRTIRLDGEALFRVVPQSGAPFTVRAGPSVTHVLGTSFAVRHYATDSAATITVRDGKVETQSRILTAQQRLSVSLRGVGQIQPAPSEKLSFESGVLTIDSLPLAKAIPELNRWYDADVRLGTPMLSARKINGEFEAGSLTDLTAILEQAFAMRVVRDGRVLTLYPRE